MSAAQPTATPGIDVTTLWDLSAPNPWKLPWLTSASPERWVLANAVVAIFYAGLGALVGRFFGAYGLFPAPIWLPAGIGCVACMVGGARMLPGIFLGSLAVNWGLFGSPLGLAATISVTNAIGPWVGTRAMRVLRPPSGLFTRFLGVIGFILGGVQLHAAITAAGGTLAMMAYHLLPSHDVYRTFSAWWLCDSGGTFFFAPALLLWLGAERTPQIIDHSGSLLDTLVLLATLLAATLLFAVPGMGQLVRPEAVFLLTVPLSWITLRVSLRAAYTLLTLIYIIATVGTMVGSGPFQGPTVANPLQSVGLMTVLFAMDALTLIALTSERREAEARLAETRSTLERAAADFEHLRRESLTDPLTGIGNRRFFMARAGAALLHARHAGRPFALILLDLDHFKRVNDTGGHAMGDATLQAVAQSFAGLLRSHDILARIGGEEFAVALPDTTAEQAAALADRLREIMLRIAQVGIGPLPQRVTASFGIATATHDDVEIDHLLLRADAAMYMAKARGRNRVEVATHRPAPASPAPPEPAANIERAPHAGLGPGFQPSALGSQG